MLKASLLAAALLAGLTGCTGFHDGGPDAPYHVRGYGAPPPVSWYYSRARREIANHPGN
jgi:hypothetical protein